MKNLSNITAVVFIISVVFLTGVSVLGVWELFDSSILGKSYATIGLLCLVTLVVMVAEQFISKNHSEEMVVPGDNHIISPAATLHFFSVFRVITLAIVIASAAILGLLGVLAIWEVLSGSILYKSLSSIAIIGFSSLVIVLVCLGREDRSFLKRNVGASSLGLIILFLIGMWLFMSVSSVMY